MKRSIKISAILACLILIAIAVTYYKSNKEQNSNVAPKLSQNTSESKTTQTEKPINLQPIIDAWVAQQSGTSSVVVYDLQTNNYIATYKPDEQYFTASIYKIYVAYLGYLAIQSGKYDANEPYLTGYTRKECLDAMIRDSYSPCGEKMWNELGKETITNTLKTYGLSNTSMTGLFTSAKDTALLLQRLYAKKQLNTEYTQAFLDSMLNQDAKYRRGLPSGFTGAKVYNKVGWNENIEWHDAAIVTLPNDKSYVVVVLSKNVGYKNAAVLAQKISAALPR